MKRYFYILFLFSTLVILGACKQQVAPAPVNAYKVQEIAQSSVTLPQAYSAAIEGKQDIIIVPQVAGTITDVKVQEGDQVRVGQALFTIDQVPYRAAVLTAKANVEAAQAGVASAQLAYDSKKALFDAAVISDVELQAAYNALQSAQAQLAQMNAMLITAENNLTYTQVLSPANGVVGKIPFRIGTLVGPTLAQGLTTVSDNSQMHVYFSITERQLLQLARQYETLDNAIAEMPPVQLELIDGSIYKHAGRVQSISGVIDPLTGSISVRAVFDNPEGLLRSGGAGRVIMPTTLEEAILIPKTASYEIQDKRFVFTIVDGKAQSIPIEVYPQSLQTDFIVTDGLDQGTEIIVEGVGMLRNGMPVEAKK